MRYTDILLEYNRDQTAKNYGEKIIAVAVKDRSIDLTDLLGASEPADPAAAPVRTRGARALVNPAAQKAILDHVMGVIEAADPTKDKNYAQAIARFYSMGGTMLEDIATTLSHYLIKFDKLKNKKKLPPPLNDFMRYKNLNDFMTQVESMPDPDSKVEQQKVGKIQVPEDVKYDIVHGGFDDKMRIIGDCVVIVPKNSKAAYWWAKLYPAGMHEVTNRWCTAWPDRESQFAYYTSKGPLYIIIPANRKFEEEKFQFHFETKQYKDYLDHEIRENGCGHTDCKSNHTGILELTERCPSLTSIFASQAAKYSVLGLMSPEYKAAVRAHARVAAPQLAELITEKVKVIANPQVTNTSVGFSALKDYGITLAPEVKKQLIPLIEQYVLQARDALVAKDGFWSKVVKTLGSERNEGKLETFLNIDATLRSLAEDSAAGKLIEQIVANDSAMSRKIDATHMQDLLMRDPLFRVIMKMVPRMYAEVLDKLQAEMVKENRNYDDNRTGFRKSRPDVTGEEEPHGVFTVMIDGRAWKTATSNEAFRMAGNVARKYPNKLVQVKWPNGALNTVKEDNEKQDMTENFNSKQEMIAHFVKQGKTAAQGAAAWERTQGQTGKKKPNPFDPNYKFKPVDNSRYGEKDLDEGMFGSKKPEANFEIYLDGCDDAHAVKKYLLNKFGSRGWQVFAAGAGTGKTFVTMTAGLYPTENEAKWDIESNCGNAMSEDWQKVNKHDRTDGMSRKAVSAYRREHPGSKLKTAVTTKPSKLKKGSKSAKRRASFCARMKGMKKAHASAKTKRDPDSPINKALRRWNCESVEEMQMMLENAQRFLAEKQHSAKQRAAIAIAMQKAGKKPKGVTEDDWHSAEVGDAWHGTGNDATDAWHGASSGGPMVESKSKPLIRKVERKRADDSVETTYELVDINGHTLKTGMSRESALSALKAYKQKQGIKEGRKQFSANNKQDLAQLMAISESIKGKTR